MPEILIFGRESNLWGAVVRSGDLMRLLVRGFLVKTTLFINQGTF